MNKTNEMERAKMKSTNTLEQHRGIIMEALKDYRRWFSEESQLQDIEKTKQIDEAIKFLENMKETKSDAKFPLHSGEINTSLSDINTKK
jgi:hypothetical protein